MRKLDYKITDVSHIPAAFRPVPQSCTSSTLLPHMTKTVSRYATLSSTFIIKQALNLSYKYNQLNPPLSRNALFFTVFLIFIGFFVALFLSGRY